MIAADDSQRKNTNYAKHARRGKKKTKTRKKRKWRRRPHKTTNTNYRSDHSICRNASTRPLAESACQAKRPFCCRQCSK